MAVESRSLKFSKATISMEGNDFILEEVKKDDSIVTNLTNKLKEYVGIEGLEISIMKKSETASEE